MNTLWIVIAVLLGAAALLGMVRLLLGPSILDRALSVDALLAFAAEPSVQRLQASSWETYGESPVIPPGVVVLYQGDAAATGPITIGVRVTPWQQPVTTSN